MEIPSKILVVTVRILGTPEMVRGHAKEVAQQKNALKKQKEAKAKNSTGPPVNQSLSITCAICMAPFMAKAAKKQLQDHSDAKHPKNKFEDCFPNFVEKEKKGK
eukprot:gb/GEZN01015099.1/.p1 GENE.gb/GEZN01015099.1/~~gb/GEZN01015099.1/.p1  ORF type:complete len:104 (-),score=24.10 gb/GEZN01015099.1/:553-864(-)